MTSSAQHQLAQWQTTVAGTVNFPYSGIAMLSSLMFVEKVRTADLAPSVFLFGFRFTNLTRLGQFCGTIVARTT